MRRLEWVAAVVIAAMIWIMFFHLYTGRKDMAAECHARGGRLAVMSDGIGCSTPARK